MNNRNFEIYEKLRADGHTEEQALREAKAFLSTPSNGPIDELATRKDLKISLFEFAKEYKLDFMNMKLNFILWAIAAMFSFMISGFGFVLYKLFDIIAVLPK